MLRVVCRVFWEECDHTQSTLTLLGLVIRNQRLSASELELHRRKRNASPTPMVIEKLSDKLLIPKIRDAARERLSCSVTANDRGSPAIFGHTQTLLLSKPRVGTSSRLASIAFPCDPWTRPVSSTVDKIVSVRSASGAKCHYCFASCPALHGCLHHEPPAVQGKCTAGPRAAEQPRWRPGTKYHSRCYR